VGNKYTGGRIGYAGGPVNIAVARGNTSKDGGLADDYTDTNVGGSVAFGPATIMAQYSKRDFLNRDQKTYLVGGTLAFGQSTLKASYVNSKGTQGSNATDFDAKLFGLGYQYDLSKRTALYGSYGNLKNDGSSRFTIGNGPALTASNQKSSGLAVGVRHSF
jgi:predicted porin